MTNQIHILTLVLALAGASDPRPNGPAHSGQLLLVAGGPDAEGAVDGPIAVARFSSPGGIAVDGAGNVYLTDGHAIRKISTAGVVTTVAGRVGEWGNTDGAGTVARFNHPKRLATDAAGNVYVADSYNNAVRRITPSGVVSTLTGATAHFHRPEGIAVDDSGNVFVSDTYNFTIRKISAAGVLSTVAGRRGESGSADGPAESARLGFPEGLAVDVAGNLYVADFYLHVIRRISPGGAVTTLAGQKGPHAMGHADGVGVAAQFAYPSDVVTDRHGNLYVADSHSRTIRKIAPTGSVTTIAGLADHEGSEDGPVATARFNWVGNLAVDRSGDVYVTDFVYTPAHPSTPAYPSYSYIRPGPSGSVRKITGSGVVSTVAGGASGAPVGGDGVGTAARFEDLSGIVADRSGTMYVTDSTAYTVCKITPSGEVITLAGKAGVRGRNDGLGAAARFDSPSGIAVDGAGTLYVTDPVDGVIRKITPDGAVTTLAGMAGAKGSVDGVGSAARFRNPTGIAVDNDGNLYVVDPWAANIRKITPAGVVTTFVSSSERGSVDGPIGQARFGSLAGIAVDRAGNLYVCDYGNETVRKITQRGEVSTLAGGAGQRGSADGTGAAAKFKSPIGIAVDRAGNLYVTDAYTLRQITPTGVVTTVAGVADEAGVQLGSLPGRLESPSSVAVIDAKTLVLTARYSVLKIVLDEERKPSGSAGR